MSQTPPQVQYVEAPPRGLSIASLVIGLVSILLGFTFIVPLAGLILGILGAKREPAGKGMAIAGIVINAIILAFVVLSLIVFGLLVGLGLLAIPFFASY